MVALVGLVPPGFQEYVTPDVEELPVKVTELLKHVNVCDPPAEALGILVFEVTVTTEEVTHDPTDALSVYVPELETFVVPLVGAEPPGDQEYPTPEVEEEPLIDTVGLEQVIVGLLPTDKLG